MKETDYDCKSDNRVINHFHCCNSSTTIEKHILELIKLVKIMTVKVDDLEARFTEITTKLEKARVEIVDQVARLRDELANHPHPGTGEISATAETALMALTAVADALDALNEDVVIPPVEPPVV